MRYFQFMAFFIAANVAWAGSAKKEVTNLEEAYKSQQSWEKTLVSQDGVPVALPGSVDKKGNLYLDEFFIKNSFQAKLRVPRANPDYKAFHKLCQGPARDRAFLSFFREEAKGNKYFLDVRYLPKIQGFTNSPYDRLETTYVQAVIKYGKDAVYNQMFDGDSAKQAVEKELQQQLKQQKELGVYRFDLTNMDDFVCDLVRGNVEVTFERDLVSRGPWAVREELVPFSSVEKVYNQWHQDLQKISDDRKKVFFAGFALQRLQHEQEIALLENSTAYKLLDQLVPPGNTVMPRQGIKALRVVYDSLQNYRESFQKHLINVQLVFGDSFYNLEEEK